MNIIDFIKINKSGTTVQDIVLPKTIASAVYLTNDMGINARTLESFVKNHSHTMADISDLNMGEGGQLLLQPLTVMFNGSKMFDYNGLAPKTLEFSLNTLGAAADDHDHDNIYANINHAHSGYAPLVHQHVMADISDFTGGGSGEVEPNEPLTIQINGFDNISYTGTEPKTLNLTADLIGAAAASHEHSFGSLTDIILPKLEVTLYGLKDNPDGGEPLPDNKIYEYDGTVPLQIEIFPSDIGAAKLVHEHFNYSERGHTHTLSDITDYPTDVTPVSRMMSPQSTAVLNGDTIYTETLELSSDLFTSDTFSIPIQTEHSIHQMISINGTAIILWVADGVTNTTELSIPYNIPVDSSYVYFSKENDNIWNCIGKYIIPSNAESGTITFKLVIDYSSKE